MTKQMEQMIFDEGRRRGREEATAELMAWHNKVCEEMAKRHTADRPKGEWIDTGKDKEHLHPLSARWYRCSVCGLETNTKTNYCFDCGADMRGEDNE